jgi:hypothetical protein
MPISAMDSVNCLPAHSINFFYAAARQGENECAAKLGVDQRAEAVAIHFVDTQAPVRDGSR